MIILEQTPTKLSVKRRDFFSFFSLFMSLVLSSIGWFALVIFGDSFNYLLSGKYPMNNYAMQLVVSALIGVTCIITAITFVVIALFNAPYSRIFTFDKERSLFTVKSKSLIRLDRQFLSTKLPKPLNNLLIGDFTVEYPLSEIAEVRYIVKRGENADMDGVSIILKSNIAIPLTEVSGGSLMFGKQGIAELIQNFLNL